MRPIGTPDMPLRSRFYGILRKFRTQKELFNPQNTHPTMIKTVQLNDYFEWDGQMVKCQWITGTGVRSIGFVIKKPCPHCGEPVEHAMNVIESSPNFQETAKPIQTIKEVDAEFV